MHEKLRREEKIVFQQFLIVFQQIIQSDKAIFKSSVLDRKLINCSQDIAESPVHSGINDPWTNLNQPEERSILMRHLKLDPWDLRKSWSPLKMALFSGSHVWEVGNRQDRRRAPTVPWKSSWSQSQLNMALFTGSHVWEKGNRQDHRRAPTVPWKKLFTACNNRNNQEERRQNFIWTRRFGRMIPARRREGG